MQYKVSVTYVDIFGLKNFGYVYASFYTYPFVNVIILFMPDTSPRRLRFGEHVTAFPCGLHPSASITIKFLKIRTPEKLAVITLNLNKVALPLRNESKSCS